MAGPISYHHTQKSPFAILFAGIGVLGAAFAALFWGRWEIVAPMAIVGFTMLLLMALFSQLTISGDDTGIRLQYGPLPWVAKRFRFDEMSSVEASQSRLIDGWGIHFVPFRGWTYNLWGFQCVLIRRHGKSPVRVGTDDVEGLLTFLQSQVFHSPDVADIRTGERKTA